MLPKADFSVENAIFVGSLEIIPQKWLIQALTLT